MDQPAKAYRRFHIFQDTKVLKHLPRGVVQLNLKGEQLAISVDQQVYLLLVYVAIKKEAGLLAFIPPGFEYLTDDPGLKNGTQDR